MAKTNSLRGVVALGVVAFVLLAFVGTAVAVVPTSGYVASSGKKMNDSSTYNQQMAASSGKTVPKATTSTNAVSKNSCATSEKHMKRHIDKAKKAETKPLSNKTASTYNPEWPGSAYPG